MKKKKQRPEVPGLTVEKAVIKRITIKNVLGLDEFEVEPGKVTLLEGANATGKTSFLRAVQAALGGGFDTKLVRLGEESGEVVLVIDEDGDEVTLSKKIKAEGGGEIRLDHLIYGVLPKPQTHLDAISDDTALNPVTFLTAPQKERVDLLLEALPIELDPEWLSNASGLPAAERWAKVHPLVVIDEVYREVFDARTVVNRLAREKKGSILETKRGLPEPEEAEAYRGAAERARKLREDQSALRTEVQSKLDKVRRSASEARERAVETARIAEGAIEADYKAALKEIEEARYRGLKEAAEKKERGLAEIEAARRKAEKELEEGFLPEDGRLEREAARLEEAAKSGERVRVLEDIVARQEAETEKLEAESEAHTKRLDRIKAYKERLLADLPIEGLEIRDGAFYLDGIPLETVNDAALVKLSVEVAMLRTEGLPLRIVLVDGLERLDSNTFKLFIREIGKTPLQMIGTRVVDRAGLSVRTGEEASK